jgi:signal transduction histidine kinase
MNDEANLREQYAAALGRHLDRRDEVSLAEAYELGRRALAAGKGVFDMAVLQQEALTRALRQAGVAEATLRTVAAAGNFFVESLSPLEMTHRGVRDANAALRHINEVHEAEIKRIAHLLHAETGQYLTATHLALNDLELALHPADTSGFRRLQAMLDQVEQQMRRFAHELRPTILDDLGLAAAIEFLGDGITSRTGIAIAVEGSTGERFPQCIETGFYRIVQEALNNVVKHARATRVTVRLRRQGDLLECTVVDDGIGFDSAAALARRGARGLGLIGMAERSQQLGGTWRIQSSSGRGTEIVATVPLGG